MDIGKESRFFVYHSESENGRQELSSIVGISLFWELPVEVGIHALRTGMARPLPPRCVCVLDTQWLNCPCSSLSYGGYR